MKPQDSDQGVFVALARAAAGVAAGLGRAPSPFYHERQFALAKAMAEGLPFGQVLDYTIDVNDSMWQLPSAEARRTEVFERARHQIIGKIADLAMLQDNGGVVYERFTETGAPAHPHQHGSTVTKHRMRFRFAIFPIPITDDGEQP